MCVYVKSPKQSASQSGLSIASSLSSWPAAISRARARVAATRTRSNRTYPFLTPPIGIGMSAICWRSSVLALLRQMLRAEPGRPTNASAECRDCRQSRFSTESQTRIGRHSPFTSSTSLGPSRYVPCSFPTARCCRARTHKHSIMVLVFGARAGSRTLNLGIKRLRAYGVRGVSECQGVPNEHWFMTQQCH